MVLIVGGAAQGKLRFARETLGVTAWRDGALGPENCVFLEKKQNGLYLSYV